MQSWYVKKESSHGNTFNQGTITTVIKLPLERTWHPGHVSVWKKTGAEQTCHTAWGLKQQRLHRCQSRYCALACHAWSTESPQNDVMDSSFPQNDSESLSNPFLWSLHVFLNYLHLLESQESPSWKDSKRTFWCLASLASLATAAAWASCS